MKYLGKGFSGAPENSSNKWEISKVSSRKVKMLVLSLTAFDQMGKKGLPDLDLGVLRLSSLCIHGLEQRAEAREYY